MQLRLDAADRLVELVEERRGPLDAVEAARRLFALQAVPGGMARGLLEEVVRADARLAWAGDAVALARTGERSPRLEDATFVVFDLETTGLSPVSARICEIGAVRIRALEPDGEYATLVDPRAPLTSQISALTGITNAELRGAPSAADAVRRFLAFAGEAVLVAHNARFDVSFLDREVERLTGRRTAADVVDTVALARRLLAGRAGRHGLASLAHFFGTSVEPCHRALPDAQATAEILLRLIGLAQERGAETVADLAALAATRTRRVHDKRGLAFGAPQRPGVYLFRDRAENVLYVGRARDLRARLRSYFGSQRLRPAVEAALGAVERIEWRVLGSELEAALEELRLIRELRPAANARSARPDRYVYLRRRGGRFVVTSEPGELGPIRSRSRAQRAARALGSCESPGEALGELRARMLRRARALQFEDAARLRDRIEALESVASELSRLDRLRRLECALVAPDAREGWSRVFLVRGGCVRAVRTVAPGALVEIETGVAEALRAPVSLAPETADELALLDLFVRRPPPEVTVCPLDAAAVGRAVTGRRAA